MNPTLFPASTITFEATKHTHGRLASRARLGRRSILATGLGAAAVLSGFPRIALSQTKVAMAHELPPLAYATNALEPIIDDATMKLHHGKHHQAYVDALNKALADHPDLQRKSIEELLRGLDTVPDGIRSQVRNQGGGHANHTLFWKIMTPGGSPMPDALRTIIDNQFGSVDAMKAKFEEAGMKHFGSGWVFLIVDPKTAALETVTLPNQDSVHPSGKVALFGNDVWEHAYYLKHQNRRAEYLKAWWGVVNWAHVAERLQGIRDGRVQW
jgi:superoxide dismutase, Fe-Mn family